MSIDLGSGANTLTLGNGTNTGTVKNVGTLIGGTGTDTDHAGHGGEQCQHQPGLGTDTLTLGNFTNIATVANIDTIIGGTGNDAITLATALTDSMSIDLGSGREQADAGRRHQYRHRQPTSTR